MSVKKMTGRQILKLRQRLGLNQYDFWTPLGLTQSGGSRYESGRRIPQPVQILLELAYGKDPQWVLKRLRSSK